MAPVCKCGGNDAGASTSGSVAKLGKWVLCTLEDDLGFDRNSHTEVAARLDVQLRQQHGSSLRLRPHQAIRKIRLLS